jgi:PAS domain S-box-containing protein
MTAPSYTVLIIGDATIDYQLYQQYLLADPDRTYRLLATESVAAGLELSQSNTIDVVLLDCLLPEADRLELLAVFQAEAKSYARRSFFAPPVIVMISQGDESVALKAIKSGAEDYLVKSHLTPERLQTTLNRAIATTWRDVTSQRQVEEESNQFFDLSIDLLAVGNFAGYFTRLNPAFEKVLGFTKAELMAQPFLEFVHPDDYAHTLAGAEALSNGNEEIDFENRYRHKDGSYRLLSWTAIPCVKRNLWYAIARDITDKRQLEIAQQENQKTIDRQLAEIEAIYRMAPIGLGFVNTELQYVRINECLAALNGFPVCDHIGKTIGQLLPELADQLEPLHQQVIASGQPVLDLEITGTTAAQPDVIRHWLASYYPQKDSGEHIVGVNVVVLEITDRKQAQATLEAQNLELDNFAHIVSHDLKAPLRAIANLSQWIEEDLEGSLLSETQSQMTLLRKRVTRMAATIDGLLNYARIGRTTNSTTLVSVVELLAEIIDSLAPPPTFTIVILPPLPILKTNRLLLSQVFVNLISNSIKHHDRLDGKIHISCQECGDAYRFMVADDGPGIDPPYHDKIFQIFQSGSQKGSLDSTGIGLSIVKKVIETAGGSIQLESTIGQGATFYFTWPKQA